MSRRPTYLVEWTGKYPYLDEAIAFTSLAEARKAAREGTDPGETVRIFRVTRELVEEREG